MGVLKWIVRLFGLFMSVSGIGGFPGDIETVRGWLSFMSPFWINFTFCIVGVVLVLVSFMSELKNWATKRWSPSAFPGAVTQRRASISHSSFSPQITAGGNVIFNAEGQPATTQVADAPSPISVQIRPVITWQKEALLLVENMGSNGSFSLSAEVISVQPPDTSWDGLRPFKVRWKGIGGELAQLAHRDWRYAIIADIERLNADFSFEGPRFSLRLLEPHRKIAHAREITGSGSGGVFLFRVTVRRIRPEMPEGEDPYSVNVAVGLDFGRGMLSSCLIEKHEI